MKHGNLTGFLLRNHIRAIFFSSLFFISACLGNVDNKTSISDLYGKYRVVEAIRYKGGMTSDEDANGKIGNIISICKNEFIDSENKIINPKYGQESINVEYEEGVVQPKKYSTFYDFLPERTHIEYLYLYDAEQDNIVYQQYEKAGDSKIMKSEDGFFYIMEKISNCPS